MTVLITYGHIEIWTSSALQNKVGFTKTSVKEAPDFSHILLCLLGISIQIIIYFCEISPSKYDPTACLPGLGWFLQFNFRTSTIHKVRIKSILCLGQQTLVLYLVLSDFNHSTLTLKFSSPFIPKRAAIWWVEILSSQLSTILPLFLSSLLHCRELCSYSVFI